MPLNCNWLAEIMEEHAPNRLAYEYDNVGLLLGDGERTLNRVLCALDLTDAVADEAIEIRADMIVTHHPVIFKAIKKITTENSLGRRLIKLIKNDIAVYAAHTNFDIAAGGTNDILFELLELCDRDFLQKPDEFGNSLGRVGNLKEPVTLGEFADFVKKKLKLNTVAVAGDLSMRVSKVGLCTGSGADPKLLAAAFERGAQAYVTGDVGYHNAQAALELGIGLIDATHYATEVIAVAALKKYIEGMAVSVEEKLTVIESGVNRQTISYLQGGRI